MGSARSVQGGRKRWQWRLDLSAGPDHDRLLDLLTDTALTLGMELWERTCTCHAGWTPGTRPDPGRARAG
ncbi:hypothetical protein [Kitasatospora sp. NPDC088779]|uniref:hypothetical protein n=1 Tax=Kitasatospora sp. NPDC088779 TaxID=3154964 RepID=UPI0034442730